MPSCQGEGEGKGEGQDWGGRRSEEERRSANKTRGRLIIGWEEKKKANMRVFGFGEVLTTRYRKEEEERREREKRKAFRASVRTVQVERSLRQLVVNRGFRNMLSFIPPLGRTNAMPVAYCRMNGMTRSDCAVYFYLSCNT